jgi:hypothetical protein
VSDFALAAAVVTAAPDRRHERRLTLLLLGIALLARVPFWWHGFGGHPDEWLVIRSGLDFWLHGTYYPSRVPGYPFDEFLMGGLAWLGGAAACAAGATAASLLTLAYLRGLAPLYGIRDWFWPVLAFSFEPWVWSSGTHGLDYIWGTGALIAALYYVERREFAGAGLACAIGYGFRATSLLWIIPVIRVLLIERRWQGILRFALWAAVPALIPTVPMVWSLVTRPDAWAGAGPLSGDNLSTLVHKYPTLLLLAAFHMAELFGIPAAIILLAGCWKYRSRFYSLLRREGWPWIAVLIFLLLLPLFIEDSEKTEYMLPALPGVFLVLARCLSDRWWQALTIAFIFSAFVSFGFGRAIHPGGIRVAVAAPSLRPGALLWYSGRARDSNAAVERVGAELAQPSRIVRPGHEFDRLDEFYVSSLLRRGPPAQARIACPLIPGRLSFPANEAPKITRTGGLPKPPPAYWPVLTCCTTNSAIVLWNTPSLDAAHLAGISRNLCASPPKR